MLCQRHHTNTHFSGEKTILIKKSKELISSPFMNFFGVQLNKFSHSIPGDHHTNIEVTFIAFFACLDPSRGISRVRKSRASYITYRIRMYAIYGNIYHQYTPNVSIYIYIPYMDPMGIATAAQKLRKFSVRIQSKKSSPSK